MASFRDQALLALSDPAQLEARLLPAGDTDGQRIRTMLAATYDLSAARVDRIQSIQVEAVALQHLLVPVARRTAEWTQLVPEYTRTELTMRVPEPTAPIWVDLLAQLHVNVVTEVDPGGAEAVLTRSIDDFTTLDEFRAHFRFIDLDEFLARHHIATVEELRAAFDYLVTEVRLRVPPPFDPDDPVNAHSLAVTVAALIVDPFDLAGGLRAARLVLEAARDLTGSAPTTMPIESTAAYATAVVFPATGLDPGLIADVERLYALEGVATLFLNPTLLNPTS